MVVALLVMAGCSSSAGVARSGTSSAPATSSTSGSETGSRTAPTDVQQAFVSVVARVRPEVVEIATAADLGSGVVFDTRGDIVTNDHVVGTAPTLQVTLVDGETFPASVVGSYPPDASP